MNPYAKNYLRAKTALEAAQKAESDLEEVFLAERGYINKRIYTIDNEKEFDRLNQEFEKLLEKNGMQSARHEATKAKITAEEELIRFALSIVPAKEKAILEQAAGTNWKVREQIIDLALKYEPAKP